jgi:organic radical activating enzyme
MLAGVPQVFLRLSGCNLRCSYCDTPQARERAEDFRVHGWGGDPEVVPNPIEPRELVRLLTPLWSPYMHSVSLTGGEPLLQAEELERLLPLLEEEGMPVYLETNGTLHDALEAVLSRIDFIAMDVKLPSSQEGVDLMEEHRRFLHSARSTYVFLKMVVGAETEGDELERACRILAGEAPDLTLVLQPATPAAGEDAITAGRAAELYALACAFFSDVRVIPQAHRMWGIR